MLLASLTVLISFLGVRGRVFSLERGFPTSHPIRLYELQARDSAWHAHLFGGLVNVPLVHQKYYPHTFGVYMLKIKLGSPPREFYVLFDIGSDLLWVPCRNCNVCPAYTDLGVPYHLYDYANSSTARLVLCLAPMCSNKCSRQTNHCKYDMLYGGGDYTSRYYVSDELHLDMILTQSHTKLHSSVSVIFGNSYYSINLQSIAVNGKILPVDPRAFEETIVDTGTMLAHLAEEAYNPFVASLTLAARKSAAPQFSNRTQCYLISTSTVAEAFPRISLHFDVPTEYDEDMWCIGFTKAEGTTKGLTVLGGKIVVHDLGRQRRGWAKYNCSMHVNVSVTSPSGRHVSKGSSSENMLLYKLLNYGSVGLLMHIAVFVFLPFFVN